MLSPVKDRHSRGARRGSQPITKSPPKGSKLESYVDHLITLSLSAPPIHLWSAEDIRSFIPDTPKSEAEKMARELRAVGFASLCKEEPRLWMLPRQHVRDMLVLPAIAKTNGHSIADVLTGTALLDELTDLICEDAYRSATARERSAPQKDISSWVTLCTLAALFDCGPCATGNARHEKAAKILGVDRGFTRRTEKRFFKNCSRSGTSKAEAAAMICGIILQLRILERGRCLWETVVQ